MGFFSDLVNGAMDFLSGGDKPCCAACKKCTSTFTEGTYKRVFVCTDKWYNFDIGFPVLGSKVEHITPPYYPPCGNNAFETASTNENALDYNERGVDIYGNYVNIRDYENDWEINPDRQTNSTNEGNNGWE